jgi:hypothetical protein
MEPLIKAEQFRDHHAYATALILRGLKAEFETSEANEEGENSNDETAGDARDERLVTHRSSKERDNTCESGIKGMAPSPMQMYLMSANILDPLEVYNSVLQKFKEIYPEYETNMAALEEFRWYYNGANRKQEEEKNKLARGGKNTNKENEEDGQDKKEDDEQENDKKEERCEGWPGSKASKGGGGKTSEEKGEGPSKLQSRSSSPRGAERV